MPFTLTIGLGFVVSLSLSLVLTYAVREWARRRGVVDRPDAARKAHTTPTPNVGGVAIFGAVALTLGAGVVFGGLDLWSREAEIGVVLALTGGGTLVWLLGLVDDLRGLSPFTRFALETALAGLLVAAGVRIDMLGMTDGAAYMLPAAVAVPLTIVWLVGVTNAFNLLDGSDGVAGGSALFALLTLGVLSLWWDQPAAAGTCFVLAGAVTGFLYFNFPPASIFMGDSGSLFLGFSLASLGVLTTQKVPTLLAVAIPLVAFGVPVLDTLLAIVRRVLRGSRVFDADRGHIHHRLKQLGHSPRNVALVLWALSGALCTLALLVAGGEARTSGVALALVGVILVIFVQRLRIPELLELGRMLHLSGTRRARIDRSVKLRAAAQRLAEADTPQAVLDALRGGFEGSEFSRLELWLAPESARPFAALDAMKVALHGSETVIALGPEAETGPGDDLEVRLAVPDAAGRTVGRMTLRHGRNENRFPTDLRLVMEEVVPVFQRAVARMRRLEAGGLEATRGDAGGAAVEDESAGLRGRAAGAGGE